MASSCTVGIIGMGSLGEHMAKMLIRNENWSTPLTILGSHRREERRNQLNNSLGSRITMYSSNQVVASRSNIVLLTVKPGHIKDVCREISTVIDEDTIVISTAAAVPLAKLKQWLTEGIAKSNPVTSDLTKTCSIIRCMPNIPCSIGEGVVSYYTDHELTRGKLVMEMIFSPNTAIAVENDSQMDATTLISGCGPAFFAWYTECLRKIGSEELPADILNKLLVKTMSGTAALLIHNSSDDIIKSVASPKGATETALNSFKDKEVDKHIIDALLTAKKRINAIVETL